jgi:rhodanese-related sulfurtransferase
MAKSQLLTIGFSLLFFLTGCLQSVATESNVPRITKEELRSMLGNPDVVILDVRASGDWKKSESKIKGALREDPSTDVKSWANKYPKEKTLVFYCA